MALDEEALVSTDPERTSWMDRLTAAFGRGRPPATHEFEGTISFVDPSTAANPTLSPVVTQTATCARCGQPRNASVHHAFPPDED
jgi:hypothetical protein